MLPLMVQGASGSERSQDPGRARATTVCARAMGMCLSTEGAPALSGRGPGAAAVEGPGAAALPGALSDLVKLASTLHCIAFHQPCTRHPGDSGHDPVRYQ